MSECEKIREQFWELAELENNEIPAQIKEHLDTCSDCVAELEEIKKLKAELRLLHEDAPAELLTNVMTAVKKEPKRVISINRIIKICAASVAAIFLCVFTVYNFSMLGQKNGDMMAPTANDEIVNSSPNMDLEQDKAEAELPDTTAGAFEQDDSASFERFCELNEFDYSDCLYSGTFPDDITVLYFVSEIYADDIDYVIGNDCFTDRIADRTVYVGQSDEDKIMKLDELSEIKYTRASFGRSEYFAVIVVRE